MYTITIESPHRATETRTRKRRDAASLCFRRAAYDALKANALLDRPMAQRIMARTEESCRNDCDFAAVHVYETTIRFRRAA